MSDAPQLPISSSSSSSSSTVTSLMPSLSSQSTSNTSTQSQSQSQKASPSTATTSIPPPQPHPYNATSSYNATNRVQQSNPLSPPAMTSPCFVHSYLDQAVDLTRKQKRSKSNRRSNLNNQISDDVMTPHPTNNRNDSNPNSSYFNTQHEVQSGQSPFRSYDSNQQSHPSASTSSNRRTSSHTNNKEDHSSSSTSTSADRAARDASSRSKSWSRGIRGAADSGSDEERNNRNHRNSSARRDSTDDSTDENEDVKGSGSGSGSSSGSDTYSRGSSFTLSSGEEDEDEDRVRSLTRQLAETAVGVREMSKQLGRARVKSNIHSVLIITKARDNHLIKLTRELALWLMLTPRNGKDTGLIVYVDSQLRSSKRFDSEGIRRDHPHLFQPVNENNHSPSQSNNGTRRRRSFSGSSSQDGNGNGLSESISSSTNAGGGERHSRNPNGGEGQLRYWTSDMCSRSPHLFDFVVTLGGDGTVLFCSWLFQRIVPPVMPFALGSLGFLTNFDFAHYKSVMQSALDDGIRVNLRMRFTATVYRATLPPPSSNPNDDRVRKRAIKSGRTGEIIMKSIKESGWDRIESPSSASCLDLKNEKLHENGDLSRFQRNDEEDENGNENLNVTGEVLDSQDPNTKGHFGKKGKGKDKKDKEVMCFYTRPVETFEVLNDLVVDRGPSPYVSLLEVFGDEHHMTTAQADGLCISTPTGSTAYSLSAGGSLVHPEIPAILITPICPHTLSFRPMLLPDSIELRIAVPYNSRSTAWASFDGRGRVELRQGDHIKVTASRYPFPTVCSENQSTDWFKSISRTLKWNERQRQKSFVVVEGEDQNDNGGKEKKERRKKNKGKEVENSIPDSEVHGESKGSSPEEVETGKLDKSQSEGQGQNVQASILSSEKKKVTLEDEDDEDEEDEEEDEEEEEEETETFDIDDTSTTNTRATSPTHNSKPHHHHHHHSHHHRRESSTRSSSSLSLPNGLNTTFAGNIGRSASSSQHPSRRGSQEALTRLMALTPASNQTNNSNTNTSESNSTGTTQARQSPSPPSNTSEQTSPSNNTSNSTSNSNPQSHVRPPPSPMSNHSVESHSSNASNDQSMLNSPDRFGLAGPPEPPRAISERHLAHADFRLDAIQNEMNRGSTSSQTNSDGRASSSDTSNTITDTTTVRNLDVPRAGFSTSSRSPISASSILRGVNSSGIGNGIGLRESSNASSTRRGSSSSQGRRRGSSNTNTEGGGDGIESGNGSNSSTSGGTALVVYGEDESETESESEA